MQQNPGGFEQVGAQQPVAPLRDAAVDVLLARLLSPRGETEVSVDGLSRPEPRRVVDSVPERHGGHHADAGHAHQPTRCLVSLRFLAHAIRGVIGSSVNTAWN